MVRSFWLASAATLLMSSAAFAEVAAVATVPAASTEDAEIVVVGRGEIRQVQQITAADIALTTPGNSPLKAIEKLPGVNFQSADAFGVYEWSTRISLRGFNQNQLGFTLDGVPLGDMSYGNTNGLHISRAIIPENVGVVRVSEGAGALGTASTSNLGGTIEFFSRAPSDSFGVNVSGTYGSANTYRVTVDMETGELASGGKGYVSFAHLDAGKWKGHGVQRSNQVNLKFVQPVGYSTLTAFVNGSDRKEQDYQDLSLEMIQRLGYYADNLNLNYALAKQIARIYRSGGALYPAPYTSVDDAYYDASGLRRDLLAGLKLNGPLSSWLTYSVQGYHHSNKGEGTWFTPYVPTPGGAPISVRTTEYSIERSGFLGSLVASFGRSTTTAGIWYEDNSFHQARRFYGLTDTPTPSSSALEYQVNPFFTQWELAYKTYTVQPYIQESFKLTDALTIQAGFKGTSVINRATRLVGTLPQGRIKARDWFLPQVGVVYSLDTGNEFFLSYTENMRAFASAATSGPFSTTQAGFDAISSTLKPEKSKTIDGGFRFSRGPVSGSVAAYYVDFNNRLLGITTGAGIVGNPVILQNVGRARSYGAEFAANWRIFGPVSVFGSYSYNDNKYRGNVVTATAVIPTDGKTVVDSPRYLAKGELVYDDKRFFARAEVNYMSKRYFTYLNDQSVPGRALVDASVGFRLGSTGPLTGVTIEVSANNLFDKRYVSTVGSNGYGNSGDNQTLLAGSPRQAFITVKAGF